MILDRPLTDKEFHDVLEALNDRGYDRHAKDVNFNKEADAIEFARQNNYPFGFIIRTDPNLKFIQRMAVQKNTFARWAIIPYQVCSNNVDFDFFLYVCFVNERDATFARLLT